jgi:hypothetical protein
MQVTSQIQRGETFIFRLRAQNIWGWGVYSEEFEILAAKIPLMVDDLTASVVIGTGNYRVDWTEADDQGSDLL